MIPQDTIEKIISLSKVEEVIGDFVALRRAGSNYKGCCPFHDEKTPSFVVSPAKGIYKCFGCGKAGNAVTFIKEHEKCSYFDAIRYLGKKYHVEIVETELTDEEKQRRDIKESLNIVNEFAAKYFQKTMWETEEGKNIGLAYFIERGFTEETIRKFQLGYSPQKKDAFTTAAEKAGYKLEYLQKVGLTSVGDKYKADRFHGRVMFPITSVSGTVIGFGGRVMTPANEHVQGGAKYVNSPESEVYNKSKTLYGISFAKNEIVKKDECILVEGYTDVISMHQAGICNVVASSGTSLTEEQIILINRFTQNIVIIYDG
ncbi:MAG: DNA primase, partial [Bacteroidales bacterium]|nr:DNA primase [Bacteroidales bacterium]